VYAIYALVRPLLGAQPMPALAKAASRRPRVVAICAAIVHRGYLIAWAHVAADKHRRGRTPSRNHITHRRLAALRLGGQVRNNDGCACLAGTQSNRTPDAERAPAVMSTTLPSSVAAEAGVPMRALARSS